MSKRDPAETETHPTSAGGKGPYTLLISGPEGVIVHALDRPGQWTLGRSSSCDIVVDHPSVSRIHVKILLDTQLSAEDCGSHNGTKVNGQPMEAHQSFTLRRGSVLEAGVATVVVQERRTRDSAAPPDETGAWGPDYVLHEPRMTALYRQIVMIARSDLSVLIHGETGSGKEHVAETLHQRSGRAASPMVKLNCAALPAAMIESELFGHQRGAFTGASQDKPGLMEVADGGTLFLDEIGELPLDVQAKLLRALEQGEVRRLGSTRSSRVDVRLVSATNRDLTREVERGAFRADLFFRIQGVMVVVPPLRERPLDIEALALHFAARAAMRSGRAVTLSRAAVEAMLAHPWPGNVRELRSVIERTALLSENGNVEVSHLGLNRTPSLPPTVGTAKTDTFDLDAAIAPAVSAAPKPTSDHLQQQLRALDREKIVDALAQSGGNQRRAAELLGISRKVLLARLTTHAIPRPRKALPSDE